MDETNPFIRALREVRDDVQAIGRNQEMIATELKGTVAAITLELSKLRTEMHPVITAYNDLAAVKRVVIKVSAVVVAASAVFSAFYALVKFVF